MKESAEQSSLASEAYTVVRQRILRGDITLGQVISRRKLAAELSMSFLPVSEALLRLEIEGLLESRPRAGTRVRIPSPEDVQGHYVVREALEVQAAMRFASVATPGERAELKKLAVRVDLAQTDLAEQVVDRVVEDLVDGDARDPMAGGRAQTATRPSSPKRSPCSGPCMRRRGVSPETRTTPRTWSRRRTCAAFAPSTASSRARTCAPGSTRSSGARARTPCASEGPCS